MNTIRKMLSTIVLAGVVLFAGVSPVGAASTADPGPCQEYVTGVPQTLRPCFHDDDNWTDLVFLTHFYQGWLAYYQFEIGRRDVELNEAAHRSLRLRGHLALARAKNAHLRHQVHHQRAVIRHLRAELSR